MEMDPNTPPSNTTTGGRKRQNGSFGDSILLARFDRRGVEISYPSIMMFGGSPYERTAIGQFQIRYTKMRQPSAPTNN